MKIYILIPVFNNRDVTLMCLHFLRKQTWDNFEVIVTDDGSTDGTSEAIAQEFPEVTILHGNGNLWWSGATNLALKHALKSARDDDYVLTLNNDVAFAGDYLNNLAEAAVQRPGWLIGSVSLDQKNHDRVIDTGGYIDWQSRRSCKAEFKPGPHFNDETNSLSGRGMFIPVKAIQAIGMFNQDKLPQYGGDTEFSMRAQRSGFPLCVYYGAILYSDCSISGLWFDPFMQVSGKEAWTMLTSNKSTIQVRTRLNFLLLCCPRQYLLRNMLLEIKTITLLITSIPPVWHIKNLFRPTLEKFRAR